MKPSTFVFYFYLTEISLHYCDAIRFDNFFTHTINLFSTHIFTLDKTTKFDMTNWGNAILETLHFKSRYMSVMPVTLFVFSTEFCCTLTRSYNATIFFSKLASGGSLYLISGEPFFNYMAKNLNGNSLNILQNRIRYLTGSPSFNIFMVNTTRSLYTGVTLHAKSKKKNAMKKILRNAAASVVLLVSSFDNNNLFIVSLAKAYSLKKNVLVSSNLVISNSWRLDPVEILLKLSYFINSNFEYDRNIKKDYILLQKCNEFRIYENLQRSYAELWEIFCINIFLRDKLNLSLSFSTLFDDLQNDYEDHIYNKYKPRYHIINWGSKARKFSYRIFLRSDSFLVSVSSESLFKTMDAPSLISILVALIVLIVILYLSGLHDSWLQLVGEIFEKGSCLGKKYMKYAIPLILWSFGNTILRQFLSSDLVSNLTKPPLPKVPSTLDQLLKYGRNIPTISHSYECFQPSKTKNGEKCTSIKWKDQLRPNIYQINDTLNKIGLLVSGKVIGTRNSTEERYIPSDFGVFLVEDGMDVFEPVFSLLMMSIKGDFSFKLVSNKHDAIEKRTRFWAMPNNVFAQPVTNVISQIEESGIRKKLRQVCKWNKIINSFGRNIESVRANTTVYVKKPRWAAYLFSNLNAGKSKDLPTTFYPFKAKSLHLVWILYALLIGFAVVGFTLEKLLSFLKNARILLNGKTNRTGFPYSYLP